MYTSTRYKFIYIPVPKVASTSVKWLIYHLENDAEYDPFGDQEKRQQIHQLQGYKATQYVGHSPEELEFFRFRFCIVRDPVERLLSCYNDKFRPQKKRKFKNVVTNDGIHIIDKVESFSSFVDNLQDLSQLIKTIHWHTLPQTYFLGEDPSIFTHIYSIKDFGKLEKDLSQHVGKSAPSYHRNKSNPRGSTVSDIPDSTKTKIRDLYQRDYMAYGDFF